MTAFAGKYGTIDKKEGVIVGWQTDTLEDNIGDIKFNKLNRLKKLIKKTKGTIKTLEQLDIEHSNVNLCLWHDKSETIEGEAKLKLVDFSPCCTRIERSTYERVLSWFVLDKYSYGLYNYTDFGLEEYTYSYEYI